MSFLVPENIETERLSLRQFKNDDWNDIHEYYSDTETTKYTVGRPLTEGETWRAMASMIGHWQFKSYGPYAIEEKTIGKVIGTAGFLYPNDWPELEIKWTLACQYWGKGYASEAVQSVQKTASECFPENPLISFIHSDNTASIKLALTVNAVFEKQVTFRGGRWHIYRLPDEL